MTDWRIPEGEPVCHEADSRIYTATYHLDNQTSIEVADDTGQLCLGVLGVRLENGIYGHSRFCNTDFDDKLACLNLSGV